MPSFLATGPDEANVTLLLAHGAGAPMDSDWMNAMAAHLAGQGIRTLRFEFAYMAARREGKRKPPPRAEVLTDEYRDAVAAASARRLIIGGKSLGGRVASMVADGLNTAGAIEGVVCLGYPFHPPGSPLKLRTAHLETMRCPTLICQGTRDPFGTRDEVAGYDLSASVRVAWLEGDHDLKPRKADGTTLDANMETAAKAVAGFARGEKLPS